jgi:membrane protease YdiL (CAAX protease family)
MKNSVIKFREGIMAENTEVKVKWIERVGAGLIYLVIGLVIMMLFKPWGTQFFKSTSVDIFGRLALILFLLAAALLAKRLPRLEKYWQLLFALMIMILAVSLDLFSGKLLFTMPGFNDSTPSGFALMKLVEGILIPVVIILLTWASGEKLGAIYLQKGKLKRGLLIGIIAFVVAAATAVPCASLFGAVNLTFSRILSWLPWILIAALANGFMEELLFRGLFLRRLEPFTGKWIANILIAIVFISPHLTVSYTVSMSIFGFILIPLALAWGFIMQNTDSIWASALFHAGMDIPIFLGIFSQMK